MRLLREWSDRQHTLGLTLSRHIDGVHEDLDVTNYAGIKVRFNLAMRPAEKCRAPLPVLEPPW